MADLRDILSDEEEQLSEEELMKYLHGNLSEEETYAFEKKTASSMFANDAIEGLQQFKSKQTVDAYVVQLNKNLRQSTASKKERQQKRRLKDQPWLVVTILIILAACILTYFVIHLYNNTKSADAASQTEFVIKQ